MPACLNPQPRTAASPKNKPKTMAPPPRVKCTYPNCDFWFQTDKDMRKHKAVLSEHEYCNKCDIDFETEEHLLIHKIKSNKHIVCPICGIDFGSEGGRDRHIRQIRINRSEMNREAMANQPDSITAKNTNRLIDRHWPKLRETGLENGMGDLMNFSTVTGKGKDNEKNNETIPGWVSKGRNHTFLGSPSAVGSASASEAGAGTGADSKAESGARAASDIGPPLSIGISNAGVELARIYKDWNLGNFIDELTGEYVCACGKRCLTKEAFEKHVLTESQGARSMQCPNCLKIFKSTAAIIAHWESPSLKCDLSETNMYAQIVDEVSGGMIQTAGYNEDGTISGLKRGSSGLAHSSSGLAVSMRRIGILITGVSQPWDPRNREIMQSFVSLRLSQNI
ncbi:hypothetical protein BDW67DRAFT_178426 [Aspergillus spinulosporus]